MDTLGTLCIYEGLDAGENPCSYFTSSPDLDADTIRRSFLHQWEKAKNLVILQGESMKSNDDIVLIPGLELNFQQKVTLSQIDEDAFVELRMILVDGCIICKTRIKAGQSTSSLLKVGDLRTVDPMEVANQIMELLTASDVMES